MVFKNFRFQIVLRVLALILCIVVLSWCVTHALYLRSIYFAAAVIMLTVELIWYVDSFNRDIKTFMLSLTQHDFTTYFQGGGKGKSFHELYNTLNQITNIFRSISAAKEVQHRYLEMLVEHLQVGIISCDQNEKITLINQALKKLLQKNIVPNLTAIESIDRLLANAIREIRTGETRLVRVTVGSELLQLSVHASGFFLEKEYYKLISLQNIRPELDAREMEAWQKLIRVLTHETMSSVSPITSLSDTLHRLVLQHGDTLSQANAQLHQSLEKGLEAIKIRSEGLHGFTNAYRQLTRVPEPKLQRHNLKKIVERVCQLLAPSFEKNKVACTIDLAETLITVDQELIEQVLINILQNAVDAMAGKTDGMIMITSAKQLNGQTILQIRDNGVGIGAQTIDQIFIPFFTTKASGSGIGLAISKQILQQHHADIAVQSEVGVGTTFTITF